MAPKKGGGGSSSGGHSGGSSGDDGDYNYNNSGSGSGDGDSDYDYNTSSGSGSGSGDSDYNYNTGSGSSGAGYDYDSGSGSGYSDDYDYDYGTGKSNESYYTSGLVGHRWRDAAVNALFALNIITILALVLCMILTTRFKWIREKGTDKLRNSGYFFATFCMFLHFLIAVIKTGMMESGFTASPSFLVSFIFERLFSMIGDIMIVAIITRTILEDLRRGSGKLAMVSNCLIGLLWALGLIAFSFYSAFYGQFIAGGSVSDITNDGSKYTTVFYSSYIFTISMYLTILAFIAVIKRRSTGTVLMILFVIPALFLRFLVTLINTSIMSFEPRSMSVVYTDLADSYVYALTTISIFIMVAIIGGLRQRRSEGGMSQEQKVGLSGHHYVPLGPYGPPPAPYGAQAPVGHYPQPVQYAAPVQPAPQGGYAAPGQPIPAGQYSAPIQPVQYAPSGENAALGQYVHQGVAATPATARSVSPVHDPVAVSAAFAYTGPPSTVSPPPPHDPYQIHVSTHH